MGNKTSSTAVASFPSIFENIPVDDYGEIPLDVDSIGSGSYGTVYKIKMPHKKRVR